jgi:hypothetical protein
MNVESDTSEPFTLTMHLAYAEAGVVLLESLIRLLIDRHVLSADEVLETIEATIEVKRRMAEEGTHPEISSVAAGILSSLANSIAAGYRRER